MQQRITKTLENKIEQAERYYSLISAANNLRLTNKQIALIADIAVNGYGNDKEKTSQYIYNMVGKLKKKSILVKSGRTIRINPLILPDFGKEVKLEILLKNGETIQATN